MKKGAGLFEPSREPNGASPVLTLRAGVEAFSGEDDRSLIQRCRQGEMKAAEALFRRYQLPIHHVVTRMLRGAPDAEDLVQEVFLKAFRGIDGFKGNSSFKTWLTQIAINTCLNYLAKSERKIPHDSLDQTMGEAGERTLGDRLASPRPTPDEAAMAQEVYARVEEALDKLSPEFRAVVVLRDLQDLSYEEVSQALGVNLGTVKSRLARARRQVQQWIADLL